MTRGGGGEEDWEEEEIATRRRPGSARCPAPCSLLPRGFSSFSGWHSTRHLCLFGTKQVTYLNN